MVVSEADAEWIQTLLTSLLLNAGSFGEASKL